MTPLPDILRTSARILNSLLKHAGLKVVRARPDYGSLDMYPERTRPATPRYVNFGAGTFYHPLWHNVDIPNDYYSGDQAGKLDIRHDLTSGEPLPFEDGSLRAAYMSHVVEHLRDEDVQHCFVELHRALEPGGFFRVACPDMDFEYDAFLRGDLALWSFPTPWGSGSVSIEQRFLEHFATVLTQGHPDRSCPKLSDEDVRRIFAELGKEEGFSAIIGRIPPALFTRYPENHVNWFNGDKLQRMLSQAGFANIYRSQYGQSKCAWMRNTRLFDSTAPEHSLYVECRK